MGAPAELLRAWETFAKDMGLEYRCSKDVPHMKGKYRGVPVEFCRDEDGSSTVVQATGRPHVRIALNAEPKSDPKRNSYWHRRTGDPDFDASFLVTCHATGFAERVLTDRVRAWMLALRDAHLNGVARIVSIKSRRDETDPDRLRALLELAAEVAIVGSLAYLGE